MSTNPEKEKISFDVKLDQPHSKSQLTTPVGRLFEQASYKTIIFFFVFVILFIAFTFWIATPFDQGVLLKKEEKFNFGDAIYFSIVTFTSLGYGDYTPIGIGKLFASLSVLSGLMLVATLIGKIASERQYSMLLLLHTSDCQRRLSEFSRQLNEKNLALSAAVLRNNSRVLHSASKDILGLFEILNNYIIFHLNQSRLADFGNDAALNSIYVKLWQLQTVLIDTFKSSLDDEIVNLRCASLENRTLLLTGLMVRFQNQASQEKILFLWKQINSSKSFLKKYLQKDNEEIIEKRSGIVIFEKMNHASLLFDEYKKKTISPWLLRKIITEVPEGLPNLWPRHYHKIIAERLGIANSMAQECIDRLIVDGAIPKKEEVFIPIAAGFFEKFLRQKSFELLKYEKNIIHLLAAKKPEKTLTAISKLIGTFEEIKKEMPPHRSKFNLTITDSNRSLEIFLNRITSIAATLRNAKNMGVLDEKIKEKASKILNLLSLIVVDLENSLNQEKFRRFFLRLRFGFTKENRIYYENLKAMMRQINCTKFLF